MLFQDLTDEQVEKYGSYFYEFQQDLDENLNTFHAWNRLPEEEVDLDAGRQFKLNTVEEALNDYFSKECTPWPDGDDCRRWWTL